MKSRLLLMMTVSVRSTVNMEQFAFSKLIPVLIFIRTGSIPLNGQLVSMMKQPWMMFQLVCLQHQAHFKIQVIQQHPNGLMLTTLVELLPLWLWLASLTGWVD